jgi:uncharacterized protein YneF (UPF0154 family)
MTTIMVGLLVFALILGIYISNKSEIDEISEKLKDL